MLPAALDYRDLDTPFPFALRIPQWQTERVLAEYLRTRGIPVHRGAEVTDVEQSGDDEKEHDDRPLAKLHQNLK